MKPCKVVLGLFLFQLFLVCACTFLLCNPTIFIVCKLGDVIWLKVAMIGMIGGCVYCMRGLYLHFCVRKDWDNGWIVWHIIRPFVSAVSGAVSLIFVKAGLFVFTSNFGFQNEYAYYALAFIAGLNVDNFIKKIESIFQELVGINQTRASKEENK